MSNGVNSSLEVSCVTEGGGFGGGRLSPPLPGNPSNLVDIQTGQTLDDQGKTVNGRQRNEVWDACVAALGYEPKTNSEKALWGKMTSSLRQGGADSEKILAVADWYHRTWPGIDLTITAIEKWYSHFLALHEKKNSGTPIEKIETWVKNVGWQYTKADCKEEVLSKAKGDYRVWQSMELIYDQLQTR